MRKTIALLILIALSLQLFTVAADAEVNEITEAAVVLNEAAAEVNPVFAGNLDFLQAVGVLIGYDTESASRIVTRGEFATNIARMFGDEFNTGSHSNWFVDVDSAHKYAQEISFLTETGLIDGYGEGHFYPDNDIAFNEALKLLVGLLGYGNLAEVKGGFPIGYSLVAGEIGILGRGGASQNITVEQMADMLRKALDTDIMLQTIFGENMQHTIVKGRTLLVENFEIEKLTGIVQANAVTGLIGEEKAPSGMVKISGALYGTGKTRAADFIGYEVQVYFKTGNVERDTIVYISPARNTETVTVLSEDILSGDGAFSPSVFVYRTAGDKRRQINLPFDITVIYNGVKFSGFTAETLAPDLGEVTLISNDGGSTYSTVVVKSFETCVVDKVDAEFGFVKDKFDRVLDLDMNVTTRVIEWDNSGTDINSLVEWDVLNVLTSKDGEYIRIYVTKYALEGVIGEASEDYAVIDGVEYKIAKSYKAQSSRFSPVLMPGWSGFFVLNINREVILLDVDAGGYIFGYLQGIDRKGSALSNEVMVNVYTAGGTFNAYSLANSVTIDGYSIRNDSGRYDRAVEILKNANSGHGSKTAQVIRFKVVQGEVTSIDTAGLGAQEGRPSMMTLYDGQRWNSSENQMERSSSLVYKTTEATFGRILNGSGNTIVFYVPSDAKDTSAFAVRMGTGHFTNDAAVSFTAYGVGRDDETDMRVMVLYDQFSTSISAGTRPLIVSSISAVLVDDEPRTKIVGYIRGAETTLYMADTFNVEAPHTIKDVGIGDLILYGQDSQSRINNLAVVFSASEKVFYGQFNTTGGRISRNPTTEHIMGYNFTDNRRYIYAAVYSQLSATTLSIAAVFDTAGPFDPPGGTTSMFLVKNPSLINTDTDVLEKHRLDYYRTVVYNEAEKEVRTGNMSDVRFYDTSPGNYSMIIFYDVYADPNEAFIYNFKDNSAITF